MKSYKEWKDEKEAEQIISELDFNPAMYQAMKQGGVNNPQLMGNMMNVPHKNAEAELDSILSQSIVPLKRFVAQYPAMMPLISRKLHNLWMNIRSGTPMQGRAGMVSRRMDQINQQNP